jgi:hypothetical protein
MSDLSIRTLMLSVGALAPKRAGLLETRKATTLEQDGDDQLCERVLDNDQALDELADACGTLWGDRPTYPTSERLSGLD